MPQVISHPIGWLQGEVVDWLRMPDSTGLIEILCGLIVVIGIPILLMYLLG